MRLDEIKIRYFRITDNSYKPTILLRSAALVVVATAIIALSTYDTMPIILTVFLVVSASLMALVILRWSIMTIRYRIRCSKSQKGKVVKSVVDENL